MTSAAFGNNNRQSNQVTRQSSPLNQNDNLVPDALTNFVSPELMETNSSGKMNTFASPTKLKKEAARSSFNNSQENNVPSSQNEQQRPNNSLTNLNLFTPANRNVDNADFTSRATHGSSCSSASGSSVSRFEAVLGELSGLNGKGTKLVYF